MATRSDVTGKAIREARTARGWTQQQLAERLDVATDTVSRWEREAQPRSTLATLALCHLLRIKPGKRTKTP